jgi:hypothetical protein
MTRIVYSRLLGGWFIVRGPHQAPIAGRFATREDCLRWLGRDVANEYRRRYTRDH